MYPNNGYQVHVGMVTLFVVDLVIRSFLPHKYVAYSLPMQSMDMSPTPKDIQKLLDFVKLVSRVEKSPGFSTLLGLDFSSLKKDQIEYDGSTLTVQLSLTNQLHSPKQDSVSLSTFLSIIDDTST